MTIFTDTFIKTRLRLMKFIDGDIISCLSQIASDESDNVAFQECHVHDGKDLHTWVVGILLMFSCCVISYKDRTSHHLAPTFFLEILLCKSHLTFHNDGVPPLLYRAINFHVYGSNLTHVYFS